MDIDGDGRTDILSGCYSRHDRDMAGLFWVLKGQEDGTFAAPTELRGTDGEPLIISAPSDHADAVIAKICTRPTAIDLDGDGHLDVVAGNFEGTFHFFRGLGEGRFEPASRELRTAQGGKLTVNHHSDPVFWDWDGDGDLDLVSGSGHGVHWAENTGRGEDGLPRWSAVRDLFAYAGEVSFDGTVKFGEGHIDRPQGSIRLWIEDLNGDGLFDLLMGDNAYVTTPAAGLSEDEARAKLAAWQERMDAVQREIGGEWTEEVAERFDALWEERAEIVSESGVGFVWVAYQRAAETAQRD